jgi:chloride channel protein, CIC family
VTKPPRQQKYPGRVRVPPPLISHRLPSGRGATEQPNVTDDGDAALTPKFWLMVVATRAAWFLLRRYTAGEKTGLDDVVWGDDARLSFRRSLGTSVISEVVIGMGASMGRENPPKLMGGVSASVLAGWARLTPAQRRLLMACGGGAGLAAVYNVPLGGALFTAGPALAAPTQQRHAS